MEDLQYNTEKPTTQRRRKERKEKGINWVKLLIPAAFWLLLAGGSYFLASQTIEGFNEQLAQIQQENQRKVAELKETLAELQNKLGEVSVTLSTMDEGLQLVQEELELAGATFNSSDETKQALSEQMTSLNKELEGLRKSIQKLEEAARVY